ncbi:MAG: MBL fold metallo-hydrolase [Acetivibrionales bacterium]|jgi:L-ascorbate metabolism protein UlaG (beta-lactamase superfamily)
MKIKWLGHSCFLITSESGVRMLTDPFDNTVGYELPKAEADIVTSSHNHFDHNHICVVKGNFKVVEKPGEFSEKGIGIKGVPTYHDKNGGKERGENIVYNFTIDGINVCHCGDLGHILTEEQVNGIGSVDILLLPVGGTFTIDAAEAKEVMEQLNPKVVIPMHYKTDVLDFPVDGVDKFLSIAGGGKKAGRQEIEISKECLDEMHGIVVLEYK